MLSECSLPHACLVGIGIILIVLGIVIVCPKWGQVTTIRVCIGVLTPYPEPDWNQGETLHGYLLVNPHLDDGQGKVVRSG